MEQSEINRSWSENSENYDSIIHNEFASFRTLAWQKQILSHFPEGKRLRILDIGCGPAFFSIILSACGHDVIGIDGAEGMLLRARANVSAAGSTATILEMNAASLQFPDASFDLLVSRNVTHTLLNHVNTYKEWKRVLKPDGCLLIYDANWHLSETVPEVRARCREDWHRCIVQFGSDYNGNTDPNGPSPYDGPTTEHPLADLIRPDYDIGILRAIGFRNVFFSRNIIENLWDEKEKVIYGFTPMFEICAKP